MRHPIWLDSSDSTSTASRFSIAAWDPDWILQVKNHQVFLQKGEEAPIQLTGDPFEILKTHVPIRQIQTDCDLPFYGGFLGMIGYDAARYLPDFSMLDSQTKFPYPEIWMGFYPCALVKDHLNQVIWEVCFQAESGQVKILPYKGEFPFPAVPGTASPFRLRQALETTLTESDYHTAIATIRHQIREGEIYQANFTYGFAAPFEGNLFDAYVRLRSVNPAPFSAFLDGGSFQLLSSSPERFIHLQNGRIRTYPIKGTSPRSEDPVEDAARKEALRNSEKNKAELVMIIDLERHDLGKVCRYGSIRVPQLASVETFAYVHHLIGHVEGELLPDLHPVDVFKNLFPGGSITGAPKIRAVQLLNTMESHQRGIYTGCIGYISIDGQADFNIAIRTLVAAGGQILGNVGGGIVSDSDPRLEWEETKAKAKGLYQMLEGMCHG